MVTFGDRMRDVRKKSNLTLEELATKLETTKATLSRYENNKRSPDVNMLKKIASVLDVDVNYLLGVSDNKDPQKEIPEEFTSAEEAMQFILRDNTVMGFGGFDVNTMSDDEVVEFANELLNQLRILSYKYKK